MAKDRRDSRTLDLLAMTVEVPHVPRFDDSDIRAARLDARIAKAVGKTLKDAASGGTTRPDVAKAMSAYLGETVTRATLDAYAAESKADHTISLVRAMALMEATKDYRLLGLIADDLGLAIVPRQYEPAIREAVLAEKMEEMRAELESLRRTRKASR
jgi:hypothetical protein